MKTIDLAHVAGGPMLSSTPTRSLAMYVIAGVSGHTGSVVASTLLADKQPVRVIVRDAANGAAWQARGAEVAIASLDDEAALGRALAGAKGAYLLIPPSSWNATDIPAPRAKLAAAVLGAVRAARPGHVVLLSSVGAELASGTGPIQYIHPIEEGLREAGVPSTFLRAAYFMDNWAGVVKGAIDGGALYYGLRADLRFEQVATQDIGKTAARLLVEGAPAGTRVVQLAGPVDATLQDVADAISRVSGKPVKAVSVPPAATIDALVGMGASREIAAMYAEMMEAINDGRIAWHGKDLVRGSTTLDQKLRELV
jgi:uncharacterized protein YbjT (DUF2867 family)